MAFAFENYNTLMNQMIKPIFDFCGVTISPADGQLYLPNQITPLMLDDRIVVWPRDNGMYTLTVGAKTGEYDLFDPFRRELHMSFIGFLVMLKLIPIFVEGDEDIWEDDTQYWATIGEEQEDNPLSLELFIDDKTGSYTYQIKEKGSDEYIAEGEHLEKKFAMFLMCVSVLGDFGSFPMKKWASDILENKDKYVELIDKRYSTFAKKLKELRTGPVATQVSEFDLDGWDGSGDKFSEIDGINIDDFVFNEFIGQENRATGSIDPIDLNIVKTYTVEEYRELQERLEDDVDIEERAANMTLDAILEPDGPIWDNEAIIKEYKERGLLLGDEDEYRAL